VTHFNNPLKYFALFPK